MSLKSFSETFCLLQNFFLKCYKLIVGPSDDGNNYIGEIRLMLAIKM
jgi:hypothetical protein